MRPHRGVDLGVHPGLEREVLGRVLLHVVDAGERLKTEKGVRVVVVSGNGASFCAGLDFSSFQGMASGEGVGGGGDRPNRAVTDVADGAITHHGQQASWVWQEIPVPVIAAVHGHALGGGIQIALGADIRIVHPDTKLSVREVFWGLVPDMTGTFFLSRLVGADVAKELVFTARIFDGREAKELGLATQLSDDPRVTAMEMAKEIAQRSPDAVRAAKALMNGLLLQGAAEQFAAERSGIGSLVGRANQREAVMSYFEQRPPAFVDPS